MECPKVGLPDTLWALGTTEGTARPQPRSCSVTSLHPGPHPGMGLCQCPGAKITKGTVGERGTAGSFKQQKCIPLSSGGWS